MTDLPIETMKYSFETRNIESFWWHMHSLSDSWPYSIWFLVPDTRRISVEAFFRYLRTYWHFTLQWITYTHTIHFTQPFIKNHTFFQTHRFGPLKNRYSQRKIKTKMFLIYASNIGWKYSFEHLLISFSSGEMIYKLGFRGILYSKGQLDKKELWSKLEKNLSRNTNCRIGLAFIPLPLS